jgi:hypothetical protein
MMIDSQVVYLGYVVSSEVKMIMNGKKDGFGRKWVWPI